MEPKERWPVARSPNVATMNFVMLCSWCRAISAENCIASAKSDEVVVKGCPTKNPMSTALAQVGAAMDGDVVGLRVVGAEVGNAVGFEDIGEVVGAVVGPGVVGNAEGGIVGDVVPSATSHTVLATACMTPVDRCVALST